MSNRGEAGEESVITFQLWVREYSSLCVAQRTHGSDSSLGYSSYVFSEELCGRHAEEISHREPSSWEPEESSQEVVGLKCKFNFFGGEKARNGKRRGGERLKGGGTAVGTRVAGWGTRVSRGVLQLSALQLLMIIYITPMYVPYKHRGTISQKQVL